jgi:hypothetical protein
MRDTTLPSPNIGATGFHLRRVAAKAISEIQSTCARTGSSTHPRASDLRAFFAACADETAPFDVTPLDEDV